MNAILNIRIKKAEGSLVRLLGLVQRRGYDVRDVKATLTQDEKAFDVVLEVLPLTPAKRPLDVLVRMVNKLYEFFICFFANSYCKLVLENGE